MHPSTVRPPTPDLLLGVCGGLWGGVVGCWVWRRPWAGGLGFLGGGVLAVCVAGRRGLLLKLSRVWPFPFLGLSG